MAAGHKDDVTAENLRETSLDRAGHENFCEQLESYIESNPFRSMVIALVAGIAVAKLLL